ncbi:putative phosphoesterase [Massariosphaeria phaeospora]|uniref:Putative phosphoesterase n=1 Tax=Massariosphaeria phaeospora TaxID=100035 RepID=A0A7C8MFT8_9PLEO|nr:putative phosphoesterase [Massariosphaeria phaeospora]
MAATSKYILPPTNLLHPAPLTPWTAFRKQPALFLATWLYTHQPPISSAPPSSSTTIRVVCISDTHTTTPDVPPGDILVHTGDLTNHGTFAELHAQLTWLRSLPHAHKFVIAGNHDGLLDRSFAAQHPERVGGLRAGATADDMHWGDVVYLERTTVAVNVRGRLVRIYGSPLTPRYGKWAFQHARDVDVWTDCVPRGTDIVLAHGPPKGHLDFRGNGCGYLGKELWSVKPRLAVFGHIHEGVGREEVGWDYVQCAFDGVVRGDMGVGRVVGMAVAWAMVWAWYWGTGRKRMGGTTLVNAAAVGGRGLRDSYPAVVVEI